jgi:uncharacterized phiE125 gp8 family phage protein
VALKLKPFSYLCLEEVKEHLKIKADNKDYDNILTRLINTACSQVEAYIDGPVLTRQFIEEKDGNSSNVIVPDHYPVTEIVEIKIDYNRQFNNATPIDPQNTILRGMASMQQLSGDVAIKIEGTDILLRDAADTTVLGRMFTGSQASAIKLTYKAGRGETPEDLPDDLVYATLMLVEYYYVTRENRELNIKSKTNNNQGYSRESGMPKEVTDILDDYKDWSFGHAVTPQRNNFG